LIKPSPTIGIDIGFVNLSICILSQEDNKDIIRFITPGLVDGEMDIQTIINSLPAREEGQEIEVIMEDVHSFPKQGVASTFKFGFAKGLLIGICKSKGLKVNLVSPQYWKKEMNLIGKSKKDSIEMAKLWSSPEYHTALKNHNNAESFLMAWLMRSGKVYLNRNNKIL
jgi:Holliday junction resolvasome RuvABC endonuclease subunit